MRLKEKERDDNFFKNYEKKIFRVFVPHKNTQNNKMRC